MRKDNEMTKEEIEDLRVYIEHEKKYIIVMIICLILVIIFAIYTGYKMFG